MSDDMSKVDIDVEILREFVAESTDGLASLENCFVELERDPTQRSNIDAIFRTIHSIKGSAGFFNLKTLQTIAHKMETVLDWLRKGNGLASSDVVTALLDGIDRLKRILSRIAETQKPEPMAEDDALFLERLDKAFANLQSGRDQIMAMVRKMEGLFHEGENDPAIQNQKVFRNLLAVHNELKAATHSDAVAPVAKVEAAASNVVSLAAQETAGAHVKKTMRVEEETIDGFMNYIGELITSSESFNYLYRKLESERVRPDLSKEFKSAIVSFNALSQGLQSSLMEIRKVPVRNLFGKFPRLVRDLSMSLNKEIEFMTVGDETRIDKSLVEVLEDPLTHMIRNSLDHGIEMPDVRERAGKSRKGFIEINALADKGFLYLRIQDDGAGIHPEKIKAVAVKKGVITIERAREMTDKEAVQLIFAPGFSSAEKVTEVSGRGVGMDVVLTNLQKVNGSIDVDSEPGQGTTITIKVPMTVTLTVISALIIVEGSEQYVLPLENVREVANFSSEDRYTVEGKSEMIRLRDKMYPLLRINQLLKVPNKDFHADGTVMVLVEKGKSSGVLLLDRLLGLQQVVVKDIGEEFKKNRLISGGVILGDGNVALVLDVEGLLQKYNQSQIEFH